MISSKSLERMTPHNVRNIGLNYAIGEGRSPKILKVNTVLGRVPVLVIWQKK
ncbi:MAG: hypothetical protein SWZ49_27030 [Cyanobacteriota bacterium]|nr:hypothetical protein [Cyanobacteriota bacterium]